MVEFYNANNMHPLGLAMILVLSAILMLLPRGLVMVPIVVLACFVSPAQRLSPLGLDLSGVRILLPIAFIRVVTSRGFRFPRLTVFDYVLVLWLAYSGTIYSLQWQSTDAVVNRLGVTYDALGLYFITRASIRNEEELLRLLRWFCLVALPVAGFFLLERATARNMFSVFGGVPAVTWIRDGRLRCTGAFTHPIIAGCFFASMLPAIYAGWRVDAGRRAIYALGGLAVLAIVFATSSATPLMSIVFAGIAVALYPFRWAVRYIRIALLLAIIALDWVMKAPVYHLIGRIQLVGGTGYHRYNLIHAAVNNFGEWWLMGTRSTAHWGYGLDDVTNQFIAEGVVGGFPNMMIFILLLIIGYAGVGRAVRALDAQGRSSLLAWCMGGVLFVHTMNFLAVTYFGQINVVWFLCLGILGNLCAATSSVPSAVRPAAANSALSDMPRQ